MVRIGIVGLGFMGVTHYKAIQKVRRGKVVAVCTRDRRKLGGDWRGVQGNFGSSGGVQNLESVAQYREVESLIADPNVDLVDICLPTPMHYDTCTAALTSGKHVLVEKPISLSPRQADRMLGTARKEKRMLMVAHVLRFFPEFRLIKELMESRVYGKIQAMHMKRIISKPSWRDPKDNGGPAIDLHIHDVDFLQYLFGMPTAVTSSGYLDRGGLVEYVHTQYEYAGTRIVVRRGERMVVASRMSVRTRLRCLLRRGDLEVQLELWETTSATYEGRQDETPEVELARWIRRRIAGSGGFGSEPNTVAYHRRAECQKLRCDLLERDRISAERPESQD